MTKPFSLSGLIDGGWRDCAFEPFRPGIEMCTLVEGSPTVALLKYAPGGHAPLHRHTGLETVIVLEGSQRDEHGLYEKGAVVFNPAQSQHSVTSDDGCIVLIQWHSPIEFL